MGNGHGGRREGAGPKHILSSDEEVWAVYNICARVDRWLLARRQRQHWREYFAEYEPAIGTLHQEWSRIKRWWKKSNRDFVVAGIEARDRQHATPSRANGTGELVAIKNLERPIEGTAWNDITSLADSVRGVHHVPEPLKHRQQKLMFRLAAHMATKELKKVISPVTVREVWRKMNRNSGDQ